MQNELGTAGAAVGAFALVCLFGGLALAIYPGWPTIGAWAAQSDAPAWVQAIGSVIAIAVAVALPYYQAGASKRQARQQARVFIATTRGVLIGMKSSIVRGDGLALRNLHTTLRVAIKLGDETRLDLLQDTGLPQLVALRALVTQLDEDVQRLLSSGRYTADDVSMIEKLERESAQLAAMIRERWPASEKPKWN